MIEEFFDYISTNSELNIYFTMSDGEERGVANLEYKDEYIVDKFRLKKDKEKTTIKCRNLEDFYKLLPTLFDNVEEDNTIIKCIKSEIENYKLNCKNIREINIFIGSNDPNRGLSERETIDVDFVHETLKTSRWDER